MRGKLLWIIGDASDMKLGCYRKHRFNLFEVDDEETCCADDEATCCADDEETYFADETCNERCGCRHKVKISCS